MLCHSITCFWFWNKSVGIDVQVRKGGVICARLWVSGEAFSPGNVIGVYLPATGRPSWQTEVREDDLGGKKKAALKGPQT